MTNCTNCGTALDSAVIDPDTPQAGFCSTACIEEFDGLPDYVMPVIFSEAGDA